MSHAHPVANSAVHLHGARSRQPSRAQFSVPDMRQVGGRRPPPANRLLRIPSTLHGFTSYPLSPTALRPPPGIASCHGAPALRTENLAAPFPLAPTWTSVGYGPQERLPVFTCHWYGTR